MGYRTGKGDRGLSNVIMNSVKRSHNQSGIGDQTLSDGILLWNVCLLNNACS